ncbi:MAG TPA: aldehyde dehydrogenase family protein [Solirubrobacteraceae bacterium]|nr:aldehyde dehydrogenase family protein [Solirubrobacteraceae bacterium]
MNAAAPPASLTERGLLLDGRWRDAPESRAVVSPYSQRQVGSIGWCGPELAVEAVRSAERAMRETPLEPHARAEILERLVALVREHEDAFVALLALEAGKPLAAGRVELGRTLATLTLCAVEARKLTGETIPMGATAAGVGKLGFTLRVPVGVVAAITPFNFPVILAAHKLGPAIAAGCAVVLKPADKAPLAACLLADLACRAGLPEGWVGVVVGDPQPIAEVFATDPAVGLITFTGSSAAGWRLRERAHRKRVTLELGNATPVIVDDTADLDHVAGKLAASAFGFAGQSCISVQRVYAPSADARGLAERLAVRAAALRPGDPLDDDSDIGPVITEAAAERIAAAVRAAQAGGAEVLCGGGVDGAMVEPTVVLEPPADAELVNREVFGPVVSVLGYDDLEAAFAAANATTYGLQAAIFTARLDRALRAAAVLEFGAVIVNEIPAFRADQMPYGGIKDSGNTKEGPAYAIREMTEERLVVLQP